MGRGCSREKAERMYVEVFVLCISDDQLQCWDNLIERLAWIESRELYTAKHTPCKT